MSNRNLIDLSALSDPTDSHSLEELRAHLEDGGYMEEYLCECGRGEFEEWCEECLHTLWASERSNTHDA